MRTTPVDEMRVIEVAKRGRGTRLPLDLVPGSHRHGSGPQDAVHLAANASGRKAYADGCVLLCPLVAMAMAAAATSTIEVASSVLIAPYRHPLAVAHQVATIDALSGGRVILGIGPGWLEDEFTALGLSFADRGRQTEECLEIYKLAWTDPWLDYHGDFYEFAGVSMEPSRARAAPGRSSTAGSRRGVHGARSGTATASTRPSSIPTPSPIATTSLARRSSTRPRRSDATWGRLSLLAFGTARVGNGARTNAEARPFLSGHAEAIIGDLEALARMATRTPRSTSTFPQERPPGSSTKSSSSPRRFCRRLVRSTRSRSRDGQGDGRAGAPRRRSPRGTDESGRGRRPRDDEHPVSHRPLVRLEHLARLLLLRRHARQRVGWPRPRACRFT